MHHRDKLNKTSSRTTNNNIMMNTSSTATSNNKAIRQPVQQYQQRRKAVERYEPPMVHPTRPPSSPSKRAAREAYDSWTPEIPIVDPRAHVPRPSDVDYYENSSSASRLGGSQPEWDRNESWGSYKSPGQRRREMGYEFKGTQALKNYVDPRDQYERRVSNRSPEAENVYNQHRRGSKRKRRITSASTRRQQLHEPDPGARPFNPETHGTPETWIHPN